MMSNSGGEGSGFDTDSTDGNDETELNELIVGVKKLGPTEVVRRASSTVGGVFSSINKKVTATAGSAVQGAKQARHKASSVTRKIKKSASMHGGSIVAVLSERINSHEAQSIEQKMLLLQIDIVEILDDAAKQQKLQWLSTAVYDVTSEEKITYKQQAELLLEGLKLLGLTKEILDNDHELAQKIEELDRKGLDRKAVIEYAEKFIADYKENINSALKDGDYMGRYAEQYSDISTTIFCALIMLVYNVLLMTKQSSAHNFATAMVSLAEGSAPTRTITNQLASIEDASKSSGTPAAIALALAGGAMIVNGSATPAAIIVALALATPAPGRIDKDRVRRYIKENLKLEVSTKHIVGLKALNAIAGLQRITRGIEPNTSATPKKKG